MTKETWTPDVFESIFRMDADPWDFETSPYERQKLAHLLSCIPPTCSRFAVELGCATGIGTRKLGMRSDRVLAVDASETALALAGTRCADMGHVRFVRAFLPRDYPAAEALGCDLVILSEILYFLDSDDIRRLARRVMRSATKDAALLLVHWTGYTDTPCTGEEASEYFMTACRAQQWFSDYTDRAPSYRIDRLRYSGPR